MLLTWFDLTQSWNNSKKDSRTVQISSGYPRVWSKVNLWSIHNFITWRVPTGGNPFSGLEFCDTVHPTLAEFQSKMKSGYIDRIKLGWKIQAVDGDVQRIIDAEKRIGLRLNAAKCYFLLCRPTCLLFTQFSTLYPTNIIFRPAFLLESTFWDLHATFYACLSSWVLVFLSHKTWHAI